MGVDASKRDSTFLMIRDSWICGKESIKAAAPRRVPAACPPSGKIKPIAAGKVSPHKHPVTSFRTFDGGQKPGFFEKPGFFSVKEFLAGCLASKIPTF
jgi:hypothetical protein